MNSDCRAKLEHDQKGMIHLKMMVQDGLCEKEEYAHLPHGC